MDGQVVIALLGLLSVVIGLLFWAVNSEQRAVEERLKKHHEWLREQGHEIVIRQYKDDFYVSSPNPVIDFTQSEPMSSDTYDSYD